MTAETTALMMSYVAARVTVINLEVALHEMKLLNRSDLGKLQFNTERLISANKKMYGLLEKNFTDQNIKDIEKDISFILNKMWSYGE